MDDKVKEFWNAQAKQHGESDLATAPDHYYRRLEIARIIPHLTDRANILDVGCGNGYSTFEFAGAYPNSKFIGVDYSEPMIELAKDGVKQRSLRNLTFQTADVLNLPEFGTKFDIIVSERCIINLKNFDEQKKAILQMKRKLRPGGKLILVENTQEGLANLNKMRQAFGLQPISVRWHNYYLPQQEFLDFAKQHFKVLNVENIGNLYYLMSRVMYAKLCDMRGEPPDYNHPINAIASRMPSLPGYGYSPNYLFVLRNQSSD